MCIVGDNIITMITMIRFNGNLLIGMRNDGVYSFGVDDCRKLLLFDDNIIIVYIIYIYT